MEIFRTSDLEEFKELQNIEEVPQVYLKEILRGGGGN